MNSDDEMLDENRSAVFHSVVHKLLFISKRARPDLHTMVSLLCTCVKYSNVTDWKRLKRLLKFVHGMIDNKLTLLA